jgi:hypothetical protein
VKWLQRHFFFTVQTVPLQIPGSRGDFCSSTVGRIDARRRGDSKVRNGFEEWIDEGRHNVAGDDLQHWKGKVLANNQPKGAKIPLE